MSLYAPNEESSGFNLSKIVGFFLVFLGMIVVAWTVYEIFRLFNDGHAFQLLDSLVPPEIAFSRSQSGLLLPREILVFGVPIWALSTTTKIGTMLIRNGLQYFDMPKRVAGK